MQQLGSCLFCLLWHLDVARDFHSSPRDNCAAHPPYIGDLILPLCAGNFPEKSSVAYSSWVVHFYAGNCRRCRELAVALQHVVSAPALLKMGVKVGAVDCHDTSNTQLCRSYRVWKFPVLMFLSSGSRYTGPLATAEMMNWLSEVSEPGLLAPALQKMSVCPAFHLYEEPQLAREF